MQEARILKNELVCRVACFLVLFKFIQLSWILLNVFNQPAQQVRSLRVKEQEVFLDSDNLTDLRQLLVHIADSDCIALLHTAVRYSVDVAFHRPVLQCSTNI